MTTEAVRRRLRELHLKADMPAARITRAVNEVAAEEGVAAADASVEHVVERLLIHESWFFRDPKQWAALARDVLPTFGGPVRVWCAGCANGQEAWAMAMLLAETVPEWHVVATDLSGRALARAAEGMYSTAELRGLSAERRARFLVPGPQQDRWSIVPRLRDHVKFTRHNLAVPPPPVPLGGAEIVFCRNTLIYLDKAGVEAALGSIESALAEDGRLLVGAAESLWAVTDSFEVVPLSGAYSYRRARGPGRGSAQFRAMAPAMAPPLPDPAALLEEAADAAAEGRHEEAARAFRQAAYLAPDRADAHAGLAEALAVLGDARGAARADAAARRLRARREGGRP
jgi:chemotaxis protein methyltransferase CheR